MCLLLDTIYMLLQGIHLAIAISLALKDHIVFCYLIGELTFYFSICRFDVYHLVT